MPRPKFYAGRREERIVTAPTTSSWLTEERPSWNT